MKKFLSFLLCLTLTLGLLPAGTAFAAASWPENVSISADGGILMDAGSGAVLYEKNAKEAYFPASITKILTALIVIENCDLDDMVTFSNSAVNTLEPGASILGARVGDKMSVRDCLYALLLQSANEVANALAEHCSGSIEDFADLMNKTAESLGCVNSHFVNPSGLNDENHYTCAYDMALIAQAAFSNPTFVEIDSTTYYDVPAGQLKQYPNGWRYYAHHRMLKKNDSLYYDGIIGGKTGYTSLAGNTLVTCAERDGLKLIAVILNGHQTHYSDTKSLLNFGFNSFKSVAIADRDSTYQEIENDLTINGVFPGDTIRLSVDKNSVITLPSDGDFSEVTSSLIYDLDNSAPDAAVARIDYMYGDKKVGQAYLEAAAIPGFTPGTGEALETSSDSGAVTTIAVTGKSMEGQEDEAAFGEEPESENIETAGPEEQEPVPEKSEEPSSDKKPAFPLSVIKKILLTVAAIAAVGAIIAGILMYRSHKEQNERYHRQKRRENRLKDWGYSSSEFDLIMAEHLRSRSQTRKPGFFERLKNKFKKD